jgi:hypothetical protein
VSEPRQPFERNTAWILGGIAAACLGVTLVVATVAPWRIAAVPALATAVFLLFLLCSVCRLHL